MAMRHVGTTRFPAGWPSVTARYAATNLAQPYHIQDFGVDVPKTGSTVAKPRQARPGPWVERGDVVSSPSCEPRPCVWPEPKPLVLEALLVSADVLVVRPDALDSGLGGGTSSRRARPTRSFERIKSAIRGAISARKREPL